MTELGDKINRTIVRGRVDGDLAEIIDAAVRRRRYLRTLEAYEQIGKVQPGDRLRIDDDVRPRYLVGMKGTVIALSGKTRAGVPLVEVRLDRPVGKYRAGLILLHGSSFSIIGHIESTEEVS